MYKAKYSNANIITNRLLLNFFNQINEISRPVRHEINTVLEIGCGHGYSTQEIRKIFGRSMVAASDIDEPLVKDAKGKNPDIKITIESVYHLNREDQSFDLVILLEVLEHLSDPGRALQELHRVSKKYCMISVPNEPLWRILNMVRGAYLKDFGNTPGHINHWSKAGVVRLVKKYFKIVNVVTTTPWTILLAQK